MVVDSSGGQKNDSMAKEGQYQRKHVTGTRFGWVLTAFGRDRHTTTRLDTLGLVRLPPQLSFHYPIIKIFYICYILVS